MYSLYSKCIISAIFFISAAPLFLLLCVAALLDLPLRVATLLIRLLSVATRISATPLCLGSILLLPSVSKAMPQQSV
jgi:hypothetical protein